MASSQACKRIGEIDGVGPLTATAIVAAVGDASEFKNGRHLAAWLGLVPRQYSSGGKSKLYGISKRGDKYLRTLLIHGARAVLRYVAGKTDAQSKWLQQLIERRGYNRAAVAVANKNARVIQALLSSDREYVRPATAWSRRNVPPIPPPFPPAGRGPNDVRQDKEIPTADCSGNQQVDGTTGQTVVGTARAGRGTKSACKRSRRRPAEPIRDSELVSHWKSGCTGAISPFVAAASGKAWQTGGVHVRPANPS